MMRRAWFHNVKNDSIYTYRKQQLPPVSNVIPFNDSIFVRNGNAAKLNSVEVGISDNGFIEVLSGLKEGEEIISGNYTAVSKELQDKTKIKIEGEENSGKKGEGRRGKGKRGDRSRHAPPSPHLTNPSPEAEDEFAAVASDPDRKP